MFREFENVGHYTAIADEYPNFGFFYVDELLEPLPEFQSYKEMCNRHHHNAEAIIKEMYERLRKILRYRYGKKSGYPAAPERQ